MGGEKRSPTLKPTDASQKPFRLAQTVTLNLTSPILLTHSFAPTSFPTALINKGISAWAQWQEA